MLKNKKPACELCGLDEITKERIKDMARFLDYSETDIVKFLVDQYYKMQVIEHRDDEGYISMEFIPFFETPESYQQFKKQYIEEYGAEYPSITINKGNYDNFTKAKTDQN